MRQALRALKNEWNDYSEGERLIRDVTANDDQPPTVGQLKRIVYLINQPNNYQKMYMMLMRRVTDFRYLRHMEKGLIVIEYLLKYAEHRLVRSCKVHIKHFKKLRGYRYDLYGRDYGGNVRRRAKRIVEYLENDAKLENARAKAQGPTYKKRVKTVAKTSKAGKKDAKTSKRTSKTGKTKSGKKHSAAGDTNIKPSTAQKHKKTKKSKDSKKPDVKKAPKEQLAPEEDLLGDFLVQPQTNNNTMGLSDEDWLFQMAVPEQQAGQGDDGGTFGFADFEDGEDLFGDDEDDPFAEFDEEGDNKEDDEPVDPWMTTLTNLDNPLQAVDKPKTNVKGKGKTMAELASTDQSHLPSNFDPNFVNSINMNLGGQQQAQQAPPQQQMPPGNHQQQYSGSYFQPPPDPFAQILNGQSQGASGGRDQQRPKHFQRDPFANLSSQYQQQPGNTATFSQTQNRDPFAGLGSFQ